MKYDLKKEKIAVHCQTLDEAEKVVEKINKDYHCNQKYNHFECNGNKTCYDLWTNKLFGYADINFYEKEGFSIIPASDYLSQFEDVPKYGDKVWVRYSEDNEWRKGELLGFIANTCTVKLCNEGSLIGNYKHYRTTDPALDKKVLELTISEIAEKLGVDEVKIKE